MPFASQSFGYFAFPAALTIIFVVLLKLQKRAGEYSEPRKPWSFKTRDEDPTGFKSSHQVLLFCAAISGGFSFLLLLNLLGVFASAPNQ